MTPFSEYLVDLSNFSHTFHLVLPSCTSWVQEIEDRRKWSKRRDLELILGRFTRWTSCTAVLDYARPCIPLKASRYEWSTPSARPCLSKHDRASLSTAVHTCWSFAYEYSTPQARHMHPQALWSSYRSTAVLILSTAVLRQFTRY